MSRKVDEARLEGIGEGWKQCVDAIAVERQRGVNEGKRVAHLSEAERWKSGFSHVGGYISYDNYLPWEVRQAAYDAGFAEGIREAEAEAYRIGRLIARQATPSEPPTPATVPDTVNEDDTRDDTDTTE